MRSARRVASIMPVLLARSGERVLGDRSGPSHQGVDDLRIASLAAGVPRFGGCFLIFSDLATFAFCIAAVPLVPDGLSGFIVLSLNALKA